jgi:hypothetical protein
MNLNLLAYLIFFPAMMALAVSVAQTCHKHGRPWMLGLFDNNSQLVDAVNNILLVACYMVNLGYIAFTLSQWEPIDSMEQLLSTLCRHMATIVLALAALHYQNIAVLLTWSHFKHRRTINNLQP